MGQVLRASCSSVLRLMAASGISRNELLRRSLALALSMYRLLQAEASLVPENELLADGAKPVPLFAWGGHTSPQQVMWPPWVLTLECLQDMNALEWFFSGRRLGEG